MSVDNGILRSDMATIRLVIPSALGHGHRPVVFGDTGPEDIGHDHRQECKECFEQSAVDFSVCRLAEMRTDHVVEDLANCKQQTRE